MHFFGNVISKNNSNQSSNNKSADDSGSEILEAKNGVENVGTAVFRQDRLVGTLTHLETVAHLIITGGLKSCNISMPDPEDKDNLIDLYFDFTSKPKIDVSIVNGSPYIKIKIKANATISSIKQLSNKNTEDQIKLTQKYANNYLERLLLHYLYKTSKELKSDCSSLGNYALKNFKTMQELEKYNWLQHYQDSFFKIDSEVVVDSGFLLTGI